MPKPCIQNPLPGTRSRFGKLTGHCFLKKQEAFDPHLIESAAQKDLEAIAAITGKANETIDLSADSVSVQPNRFDLFSILGRRDAHQAFEGS